MQFAQPRKWFRANRFFSVTMVALLPSNFDMEFRSLDPRPSYVPNGCHSSPFSRKEPLTAGTHSSQGRQFRETLTSNLRALCVSVVNISSIVPRTGK
jgi:hypothetical protein